MGYFSKGRGSLGKSGGGAAGAGGGGGPPGTTVGVLLENGDFLITEDGDYLSQE